MGVDLYCGERYFRDSYNFYGLLQRFGLSWWQDVSPLLIQLNEDEDEILMPESAQKFLNMLIWHERAFVDSLVGKPETEKAYFYDQYEQLQAILRSAVNANEPIICSI